MQDCEFELLIVPICLYSQVLLSLVDIIYAWKKLK